MADNICLELRGMLRKERTGTLFKIVSFLDVEPSKAGFTGDFVYLCMRHRVSEEKMLSRKKEWEQRDKF